MTAQNRYCRRSIWVAIAAGAFLGIAGCSANKPVEQPAAAAAPTQALLPAPSKGFGADSEAQTSSLDQLQQGKAIGSDRSSPLKDVYFDFDRYDLTTGARETLQRDAEWLKQNPSATAEIEGHCDERGTAEYNLALGAKRAQAAKDYLTTLGVDAARLSTISYGQELPVCSEHNENCWQQNRHDRLVSKSAATS